MSSNPFLNNRFKNLHIESEKNKNIKKQHFDSSNNAFTNPIIQKTDDFIITDELFPTLTPIIVTDSKVNNFKDALNKPSEIIETNKITKGWIEIFKVDNKIVYNNENYKTPFIEANIMDKFVSIMQQKYEKYITDYDDINGEGAYNETFLTITYESDSDTEDEDSLSISVTEDEDDYDYYIDDTY